MTILQTQKEWKRSKRKRSRRWRRNKRRMKRGSKKWRRKRNRRSSRRWRWKGAMAFVGVPLISHIVRPALTFYKIKQKTFKTQQDVWIADRQKA